MYDVIYNEDCLIGMDFLPAKSIDMILCDLPYGITQNKWDAVIPFDQLWYHYERLIKDNGAIVLTANQPFTSSLVMSNPKLFKYEWIWDKKRVTNFVMVKLRPLMQHENVVVFYKKQPTYNPQPYKKNTTGMLSKKNRGIKHKSNNYVATLINGENDNEYGYPRSLILDIPVMNNLSADKSGLHPTQKPVALFEYLIKTYTNEGDVVLDNCIGSGTTAIACMNTNRHYIGFEKDETYYKIAIERINKNFLT